MILSVRQELFSFERNPQRAQIWTARPQSREPKQHSVSPIAHVPRRANSPSKLCACERKNLMCRNSEILCITSIKETATSVLRKFLAKPSQIGCRTRHSARFQHTQNEKAASPCTQVGRSESEQQWRTALAPRGCNFRGSYLLTPACLDLTEVPCLHWFTTHKQRHPGGVAFGKGIGHAQRHDCTVAHR